MVSTCLLISFIIRNLSILVFKYTSLTSTIAMALCSCTSLIVVNNIEYGLAVGEV